MKYTSQRSLSIQAYCLFQSRLPSNRGSISQTTLIRNNCIRLLNHVQSSRNGKLEEKNKRLENELLETVGSNVTKQFFFLGIDLYTTF